MLPEDLLILKGVVPLRVGHSTAVKPHIYQVWFTVHGAPIIAHQHYAIDVWTMEIDAIVVLLPHVARLESA